MDWTPKTLHGRWLGRKDFEQCLQLQLDLREAVVAGTAPQTLLLVEHPATVTLGRRGEREHLLWDNEALAAKGMAVHETPRGGEATLHAPGQLVVYPIVRVDRRIRAHIIRMAEVTIGLFEGYGATDIQFRMDQPGVWQGQTKVASIGIHVSRGVCVQGMSMNVNVDKSLFGALVSCGMPTVKMASLVDLVPGLEPPKLEKLARAWATTFAESADLDLDWS